jgi:eukaryotic-like serine/threonine-protein kinase
MEASTKKIILIVIASASGVLLLAALFWFLIFNSQFIVYQDDQYKFSIKYPATWKIVIHPQANVAVVFVCPKETALDTVQENFNVTIQPVPDNILNLPAFSAAVKRQMTGTFGKNLIVAKDKPLQWGWRQGHEMIFDAPVPDHLRMVNAWVLRGDQAFILTFLGDMNKYAKDGLVVDEMIRSLKLQ